MVDEVDDKILVEGVFVDFESNTRTLRTVPVSKSYIPKSTKIKTPLNNQRLMIAIAAGGSKAVRNAVLAALPAYLVDSYYKEAKRLAGGGAPKGSKSGESVKELWSKMEAAFIRLGVDKQTLGDYIASSADLDGLDEPSVLAHMRGIFNAIEDGQTTASAVFGSKQGSEVKAGDGVVQGDMLGGGKG